MIGEVDFLIFSSTSASTGWPTLAVFARVGGQGVMAYGSIADPVLMPFINVNAKKNQERKTRWIRLRRPPLQKSQG